MEEKKPQIGQFVQTIRGRDSGKIAVIIGIIDNRYVLLADGDKRKFDQPKKKNILHIRLYDQISEEVVASLQESGRVTNGKLRFALGKFRESLQTEAYEKGD
ncbi:MAG TPA: KOW domain-containing RNA-binding protein [Bacilli bacterium]